MNIGIICATSDEIKPFLKQQNIQKINDSYFDLYTYAINNNNIFFLTSGIGKINATLATLHLIQKYNCKSILFSGVGGAINPKLKKGDLSIAKNIAQHDLDISVFGYNYGETPNTKTIEINNDLNKDIISFARNAAIEIYELNYATGDQFIHSKTKKDWIRKTFNADIIDMESYAIGIVCKRLSIPFAIIRSISDKADDSADQDFKKVSKISSVKSANFILSYLKTKK